MGVKSNETIMKDFMRSAWSRPEVQAVMSDHIDAIPQQAIAAQALGDAERILAAVLWPTLDSEARIALIAKIGQELLVESDDTPNFRPRAY